MKTITAIFFLIGSTSFAQDISEFERGYKVGLNNCENNYAYSCKLTVTWNDEGTERTHTRGSEALTRSKAMLGLANDCRTNKVDEFMYACIKALREGKAECFKL